MKMISFARKGISSFGAVAGDGVIDLTGRLSPDVTSIRQALERGLLSAAADYIKERRPELGWADIQILPVVPDPSKILCIGLNYADHKKETGRPDVDHPTVFTRFADSQIAHGQGLVKPSFSDRFDYEGELAIVISTGGRNIVEVDALSHVAGYSCYNDGSVRDWQHHTMQFIPGKNFPGTGAFGPYLVTTDEVGDYAKLGIETRLNGETMQKASLADLIFPLEKLISYCSQFTPLSAGDVIVTGTPGGVGDKRKPPVYMVPGDTVEVIIDKVGTLSNPVIGDTAP